MAAVCTPEFEIPDTISMKEIEGIPLLVREKGSGSRNYVERILSDYSIKPLIKMESVSTQSLIEICKTGMGMLFLPLSLVKRQLEDGSLRKIKIIENKWERKYYLVYHKSKYLTQSMKLFLQYVAGNK